MLKQTAWNWAPDFTAANVMGTLTVETLPDDTLCIDFEYKPIHLWALAVFYIVACILTPSKVPSTSSAAGRPRLFELTSPDKLSPYIKHHNRPILYSGTCFLGGKAIRVHGVGTTYVPHPLSDLCELSVFPQNYLGHAERMSSELMRRRNIRTGESFTKWK